MELEDLLTMKMSTGSRGRIVGDGQIIPDQTIALEKCIEYSGTARGKVVL